MFFFFSVCITFCASNREQGARPGRRHDKVRLAAASPRLSMPSLVLECGSEGLCRIFGPLEETRARVLLLLLALLAIATLGALRRIYVKFGTGTTLSIALCTGLAFIVSATTLEHKQSNRTRVDRERVMRSASDAARFECTAGSHHRIANVSVAELVPVAESVAIVGNGGSRNKNESLILSARWVVRFNSFSTKGQGIAVGGNRTDIHVVNDAGCYNQLEHRSRPKLLLRLGCSRGVQILRQCDPGVRECRLMPDSYRALCEESRYAPSRGFMAVALLRRPRMRIFGFVGQAHYYEKAPNAESHRVDIEHRLYREAGLSSYARRRARA